MSSIGNVGPSLQAVAVRKITADDMKNVKVMELGTGTPMKADELPDVGTTASSPLLASTDDQQAAAKVEEKREEAFAKMKIELQAKKGAAS